MLAERWVKTQPETSSAVRLVHAQLQKITKAACAITSKQTETM